MIYLLTHKPGLCWRPPVWRCSPDEWPSDTCRRWGLWFPLRPGSSTSHFWKTPPESTFEIWVHQQRSGSKAILKGKSGLHASSYTIFLAQRLRKIINYSPCVCVCVFCAKKPWTSKRLIFHFKILKRKKQCSHSWLLSQLLCETRATVTGSTAKGSDIIVFCLAPCLSWLWVEQATGTGHE